MLIINQKAEAVANYAYQKGTLSGPIAFDPNSIALIVETIVLIIQAFQGCKKNPAEAIDTIKSSAIVNNVRLRLITAKAFGIRSSFNVSDIRDALREIGRSTTVDEMTKMYSECQK